VNSRTPKDFVEIQFLSASINNHVGISYE
jgi:hypothetical protein